MSYHKGGAPNMPDVTENNNIPININGQTIEEKKETKKEKEVEDDESDQDAKKKCRKILWRITTSQLGLIILLLGYSFAGAAIMQAIEGPNEVIEISEIVQSRKDLINEAWIYSQNLSFSNFSRILEEKIRLYEERLEVAITHGVKTGRDQAVWDYWGSLFFCATVFTTIGYGHISPATTTGRVVTIIYAVIGIPLFLVIMGKLGKMLTRCLKFVWKYVRKCYYADCSRKIRSNIRKSRPVQAMKEACTCNKNTDTNTKQRDSDSNKHIEIPGSVVTDASRVNTIKSMSVLGTLSRQTTIQMCDEDSMDDYNGHDEFSLHPGVALSVTMVYIFLGAWMYTQWEPWSYLEALYFLFISVSTIGFGDLIPTHQKYFLASSIYIVLGLALVAMCINVIMEFFNRTIDKAKEKAIFVGRHMGLDVEELESALRTPSTTPSYGRKKSYINDHSASSKSIGSLNSSSELITDSKKGSTKQISKKSKRRESSMQVRSDSQVSISTPASIHSSPKSSVRRKNRPRKSTAEIYDQGDIEKTGGTDNDGFAVDETGDREDNANQ